MDIVERLRDAAKGLPVYQSEAMCVILFEQAAAEIERLRADRDEWKQAAGVEASLRREFSAEAEKLRAALTEAMHYVAICPPPPEATGALRIELLEWRGRIAQAAHACE